MKITNLSTMNHLLPLMFVLTLLPNFLIAQSSEKEQDTLKMEWGFKYIMNRTAVQDEVWRENGLTAGIIRQFHVDSAKWVVTYYASGRVAINYPTWVGEKTDEGIVLNKPQKTPNGINGTSQLTFYDISSSGFKWKGVWVSEDESITFPFWLISCKKRS